MDFLSGKEVAELLGISYMTLRSRLLKGLPAPKPYYKNETKIKMIFDKNEVENWIRNNIN